MRCRICGNERDQREYQACEMMYGHAETFCYFQCIGQLNASNQGDQTLFYLRRVEPRAYA